MGRMNQLLKWLIDFWGKSMKHISNGTGSNELFEDPMNHHQICSILFHPFHHQIHEQIL